MSLSYLDFKTPIRQQLFPQGVPVNLVPAVDKLFIDALIDLQQFVECLAQDNTNFVPQCATLYNCGLTVCDAPRGVIRKVSVVAQEDESTLVIDPAQPTNYCDEVVYTQVSSVHIREYLVRSLKAGSCLCIPLFFGIWPGACPKAIYPIPTDEGLPAGLKPLPLGYHYPQASTDRTFRARSGAWAIDRGKLYLAPWLESVETVLVKWDGIKRVWGNADLIDDDPLLSRAVFEYIRWIFNDRYDKDPEESARAQSAYTEARMLLMHQCREETRIREREPSQARGSAATLTALFYNEAQSYTASCGQGQTGNPVTVTIPAGTVASSLSVADANQNALNQAITQAQAALICTPTSATATNDPQTATAVCQGIPGEPPPDGSPVTVTIPAGTVTAASKDLANQQAMAMAQSQAQAQLNCTYWNAAQTFTAHCPTGQTGTPVSKTVAARQFSSTRSQLEADSLALNEAQRQAQAALICNSAPAGQVFNNQQSAEAAQYVPLLGCNAVAFVTVRAGVVSASTQAAANQLALNQAHEMAALYAQMYARQQRCGTFSIFYPP